MGLLVGRRGPVKAFLENMLDSLTLSADSVQKRLAMNEKRQEQSYPKDRNKRKHTMKGGKT